MNTHLQGYFAAGLLWASSDHNDKRIRINHTAGGLIHIYIGHLNASITVEDWRTLRTAVNTAIGDPNIELVHQ